MPRLVLYGAAAAGALAILSTVGIQTWRLGNAQEALGEARERITLCTDANANNQARIDELLGRIETLARQREAHQERMNEAVRAARREAENAASERDTALAELEALYAGDCEAWSSVPVCGPVADRLRH